MADSARPKTPPPPASASAATKTALSPDQLRRIEANRQKAIEIYQSRLKQNTTTTTAGQKRTHDSITNSTQPPTTPTKPSSTRPTISPSNTRLSNRDGRQPLPAAAPLRPFSKKMASYVDYDFSKMTDTKGGFLSEPEHSHLPSRPPILPVPPPPSLKTGPPSSSSSQQQNTPKCSDCNSLTLDPLLYTTFHHPVCPTCKDKFPDKYSLLTKTECREDYLITDPELNDPLLLPHLSKPNPHKSTWNDMHLYLRCQVEARAIVKWGSLEELDKEFEKRCGEKKRRKEVGFKKKLRELKNRTRVETWKRDGRMGGGGRERRHEHVWGQAVDKEGGMVARTCVECGFEIEEVVL
ncbi:putative DNA repair protein Rad14 [Peziza echinospora]|nr:putative DNA repair protein Rad14 [Peziza echinospora]